MTVIMGMDHFSLWMLPLSHGKVSAFQKVYVVHTHGKYRVSFHTDTSKVAYWNSFQVLSLTSVTFRFWGTIYQSSLVTSSSAVGLHFEAYCYLSSVLAGNYIIKQLSSI